MKRTRVVLGMVLVLAACSNAKTTAGQSTPPTQATESPTPSPATASPTASPTALSNSPKTYTATEKDDNKTVTLRVGDHLTVRLVENQSTGYHWASSNEINPSILRRDSDTYEAPPQKNPPQVGAAGHHVWKFTALKTLKSGTLGWKYEPPGGGTPGGSFMLHLVINA